MTRAWSFSIVGVCIGAMEPLKQFAVDIQRREFSHCSQLSAYSQNIDLLLFAEAAIQSIGEVAVRSLHFVG
jgi:hypothetical protein